ncbi:hypothetical protein EIN_155470 [Entamoeba invadens IP1]|uniref:Uncharacterized protein n=1 Tax=Entamoeba invadens IP1 TaxID=370355 RepID=A0A0A1U933_ENTIV|nr:hypothetical protein EIN_155470 [Entamoeba invadens IP1]ELP91440.1 hypothetical protein EIN_155470 [Entamoeba invadens IP1]|eukprot:XP_004258211.1 hypothetical protein EIN_155470 [Entamoeba invadens IP1]
MDVAAIPTLSNTRWFYYQLLVKFCFENLEKIEIFVKELELENEIVATLVKHHNESKEKKKQQENKRRKEKMNHSQDTTTYDFYFFMNKERKSFKIRDPAFLAFLGFFFDLLTEAKCPFDALQEKFGLFVDEVNKIDTYLDDLRKKKELCERGDILPFKSACKYLYFDSPIIINSCERVLGSYLRALELRFCNWTTVKPGSKIEELEEVKEELDEFQNIEPLLESFLFPGKFLYDNILLPKTSFDQLNEELCVLQNLVWENQKTLKEAFTKQEKKNFTLLEAIQIFDKVDFPIISQLVKIMLCLIPTSSCVESVFSHFKYSRKSNMKVDTVNTRLILKLATNSVSRMELVSDH